MILIFVWISEVHGFDNSERHVYIDETFNCLYLFQSGMSLLTRGASKSSMSFSHNWVMGWSQTTMDTSTNIYLKIYKDKNSKTL